VPDAQLRANGSRWHRGSSSSSPTRRGRGWRAPRPRRIRSAAPASRTAAARRGRAHHLRSVRAVQHACTGDEVLHPPARVSRVVVGEQRGWVIESVRASAWRQRSRSTSSRSPVRSTPPAVAVGRRRGPASALTASHPGPLSRPWPMAPAPVLGSRRVPRVCGGIGFGVAFMGLRPSAPRRPSGRGAIRPTREPSSPRRGRMPRPRTRA
jgi:hypothetical protein